MSKTNFLLLVAAGAALATNPDEVSFRQYLKKRQKMAGSDWITSAIALRLLTMFVDRKDYKIFSLIKIPEHNAIFVGIFGSWFEIPDTIKLS